MEALRNIAGDVSAQFRLSGALGVRLLCLCLYYARYVAARVLGATQDRARLGALGFVSGLGFSRRTARVRAADGLSFELDVWAACFLAKELLLDRTYEQLEAFRPRPGWTVLDVGAHQGLFAVSAARAVGPGGSVVAIEAFPDNAARLRRNVETNALRNVRVVEAAAADTDGRAALHVTALVSGGQSLVYDKEGYSGEIPVSLRTVDGILKELGVERVDLVKIDVEGAAQRVLDGAPRLLAGRPRLVMEVEGGAAEMGAMRSRLEGLGYVVREAGGLLFAEAAVAADGRNGN